MDARVDLQDRRIHEAQFYYRSSLCATAEGREPCRRLEEELRLEQMWEGELPALRSMAYMDYQETTVRVGLYRVLRTNR